MNLGREGLKADRPIPSRRLQRCYLLHISQPIAAGHQNPVRIAHVGQADLLIDHARRRAAEKRGAGAKHVSLDDVVVAAREAPESLVALDEALTRLEQVDPRQASVVECRFFAGMSIEETAETLQLSPATVKRDWTMASAWLYREMLES